VVAPGAGVGEPGGHHPNGGRRGMVDRQEIADLASRLGLAAR
jgi:hypothetical protein